MVLSNDRVKNEELELALFYSKEYDIQKDFISFPCYVCLFIFCASKLSYIMKFSIRINNFCLLTNKDTITSKKNHFY